MSTVFWVWLAVAATMIIAEVAQPTALYWPWGLGASVAATLEAFSLGTWWQWAAFLIIPSAIIAIRFRMRAAQRKTDRFDFDEAEDVSDFDRAER